MVLEEVKEMWTELPIIVRGKNWEYTVAENMMIGSKDTETEQLDERDGEKYLLSTASTRNRTHRRPENETNIHDSQMPRISESREQ